MFGLVSKFILFIIGRRFLGENPGSPARKRNIARLVLLGAVSLVLFVQGLAALLLAAFFCLVSVGFADYYAALAVSGIVLSLSAIAALILYGKWRNISKEGGKFENIADLDPTGLISAFIGGFARGKNGERECDTSESCRVEKLHRKSGKL